MTDLKNQCLNQIKAVQILGIVPSELSHSIIVYGEDGKKYFVKLHAGLSNSFGSINEWVNTHLAQAIDLPVAQPSLVLINIDTNYESLYIENKELIKNSYGLNVAFPFFEQATEIDVKKIDPLLAEKIFLFDLFILNADRVVGNTNILETLGKTKVIDFDSTWLVHSIFHDGGLHLHPRLMTAMRNHIFFNDSLSRRKIDQFLYKMKHVSLHSIIKGIPNEWFPDLHGGAAKQTLLTGLVAQIDSSDDYWLFYNEVLKLERKSSKDRIKRFSTNRERFLKNLVHW